FVMNTGTANLTLTSIGPITGVDASDFSVQPALGTCFAGTVVAPGNSCQLYVDFMPTATGPRTAAIAIVDNAANSPQTMALSGTGTPVPGNIAAAGGTPQAATVGMPFAAPLSVTVTDATGAPVSGVTVTFTAPANGASGTFAGGVNTAATNANGVATSAVFAANATAGSYTVNATVPGLNAPATFSLTNNNPTPTLSAISPTSGTVGQSVALTLTGTNFVSGAVVNFGPNADAGGVESNGTSITITIPASQLSAAGPVNVTVTNPAPTAGSSAAQVFTVNASGLVIGVNGPVTVSGPTYSFSFPVQSVGGLGGTLNSFCSSATISCLISPCPTNLKADGSVTMTVTLYSTPQATGIFEPGLPGLPGSRRWPVALLCLAGLLLLGLLSARKPRLRWAFATAALAFALVGGCGNSGSSKGVPAGQYAMTITETLGTTTQTAQITLNVQ
ncbi:MAG TPA: choice-of-anchor D domain-containing protein, partial [Candidatus Acidoferrum sp.]|nr:choice-of-anchor D domain-containing protein [Candidatus Acidoferrum sp.]